MKFNPMESLEPILGDWQMVVLVMLPTMPTMALKMALIPAIGLAEVQGPTEGGREDGQWLIAATQYWSTAYVNSKTFKRKPNNIWKLLYLYNIQYIYNLQVHILSTRFRMHYAMLDSWLKPFLSNMH